jgi:hypothetical protein
MLTNAPAKLLLCTRAVVTCCRFIKSGLLLPGARSDPDRRIHLPLTPLDAPIWRHHRGATAGGKPVVAAATPRSVAV